MAPANSNSGTSRKGKQISTDNHNEGGGDNAADTAAAIQWDQEVEQQARDSHEKLPSSGSEADEALESVRRRRKQGVNKNDTKKRDHKKDRHTGSSKKGGIRKCSSKKPRRHSDDSSEDDDTEANDELNSSDSSEDDDSGEEVDDSPKGRGRGRGSGGRAGGKRKWGGGSGGARGWQQKGWKPMTESEVLDDPEQFWKDGREYFVQLDAYCKPCRKYNKKHAKKYVKKNRLFSEKSKCKKCVHSAFKLSYAMYPLLDLDNKKDK